MYSTNADSQIEYVSIFNFKTMKLKKIDFSIFIIKKLVI